MNCPARALERSLTSQGWLRSAAVMFFVLCVLVSMSPAASAERLSPAVGIIPASDLPDVALDSDMLADGRVVTVGLRESDTGAAALESVVALWSAEGAILDVVALPSYSAQVFTFTAKYFYIDSRAVGASGIYQAVVHLPSPDWGGTVAVFKVTAAGLELDPGFNNGQPTTTPKPSGAQSAMPLGVSFDPNGSVVLLGQDADGDQSDLIWLARLTSKGAADGSFGGSGTGIAVLHSAVGTWGQPTDTVTGAGLAVQPDGRVLYSAVAYPAAVAGHSRSIVGRLTAAGAPDRSFDRDGELVLPNAPTGDVVVKDLALDVRSGKTVLAASVYSSGAPCVVMRLTPSGALDDSFSYDGIKPVQGPLDSGLPPSCDALSVSSYDGYTRLGASQGGSVSESFVVALASNGGVDTSFASGGYASFPFAEGDIQMFFDVEIGANLVTLAAGLRSDLDFMDSALVRLLPGGSPDTSFSGDGIAVADLGGWPS